MNVWEIIGFGLVMVSFICFGGLAIFVAIDKIKGSREQWMLDEGIRRIQRMNGLSPRDIGNNFDGKWKEFANDAPWHPHFYYLYGGDQLRLPGQGYKLHIAAGSDGDYEWLVQALVPYLERYGASYKVVNPYFRIHRSLQEGGQRGKDITVYQKKWDARGFFMDPAVQNILFSDTKHLPVQYDVHIGGRLYMRYGGIANSYIRTPDGEVLSDDRTRPSPSFIKDMSLDTFILACYR